MPTLRKVGSPILLVIALTISVFADSELIRTSYSVPTKDGKSVFVMLLTEKERPDLILDILQHRAEMERSEGSPYGSHWVPLFESEKRLRSTYRASGLYRINDSTKPLYTVDWHARKVKLSNDGRYLVRMDPWPTSERDEAVSFFDNGKRLGSYSVKRLVLSRLWFPNSVSHFRYRDKDWLDDGDLTYHLTSLAGDYFVFDLKSGDIVHARRPVGDLIRGYFVVAFAIGGLAVYRLHFRKRLFS